MFKVKKITGSGHIAVGKRCNQISHIVVISVTIRDCIITKGIEHASNIDSSIGKLNLGSTTEAPREVCKSGNRSIFDRYVQLICTIVEEIARVASSSGKGTAVNGNFIIALPVMRRKHVRRSGGSRLLHGTAVDGDQQLGCIISATNSMLIENMVSTLHGAIVHREIHDAGNRGVAVRVVNYMLSGGNHGGTANGHHRISGAVSKPKRRFYYAHRSIGYSNVGSTSNSIKYKGVICGQSATRHIDGLFAGNTARGILEADAVVTRERYVALNIYSYVTGAGIRNNVRPRTILHAHVILKGNGGQAFTRLNKDTAVDVGDIASKGNVNAGRNHERLESTVCFRIHITKHNHHRGGGNGNVLGNVNSFADNSALQ